MKLPYTILICWECMKMINLIPGESIGGTFDEEPCQLCGKDKILREFRTGITAAEIWRDMK